MTKSSNERVHNRARKLKIKNKEFIRKVEAKILEQRDERINKIVFGQFEDTPALIRTPKENTGVSSLIPSDEKEESKDNVTFIGKFKKTVKEKLGKAS